jgi:hypothetical protein
MAATAKARTAARKRYATRTAPEPDDDGEVIGIAEDDPEAEPEREPVFSIGETVHTMLKDPPPSLALSAIELAERRGGSPQAIGLADIYVMREMLGEQSYRSLLNCRTMTRAQYLKITGRVLKRAMGALEDEDGSPNR